MLAGVTEIDAASSWLEATAGIFSPSGINTLGSCNNDTKLLLELLVRPQQKQ
jgi:hypothetical protein